MGPGLLRREKGKNRELLAAHYLKSIPTHELARDEGTTDPTIRNRIYRERERIKVELEALGVTG
jgi:DNA-directed RNA polymerase specialized sigma24 family protein